MHKGLRTITGIASAFRSGELTPEQVVNECLATIERLDERLKAWVFIEADAARQAAEALGKELTKGHDRGPLHGIPIGIKDIVDVAGWPTEAGSPLLAGNVATSDATIVERLRAAGAVFLGKTVTTEFACFDPPPTRNPWNLEHTPGGSSSGSAVAVATGMALAAIGSQTGGSINRPASYCGVAGFKPTFGDVSRAGVVPVSFHLDHVGPIARCVADLRISFQAMAGSDPKDPATTQLPSVLTNSARTGEQAPVLGTIRPWLDEAEPPIRAAVKQATDRLSTAGAILREAKLPNNFERIDEFHRRIMAVEAAEYHQARYSEHRDAYGPNLRGMIEEGFSISAVQYAEALREQIAFRQTLAGMNREFDALLAPATPTLPPDTSTTGDATYNAPITFLGLPEVSLPCGVVDGLPVALQLIGRPSEDQRLLDIAEWCERILDFRAVAPIL